MTYDINVTKLIDTPVYPSDFTFVDEDCKFLAEYLTTRINNLFQDSAKGNVIKTYRTWNDIYIPLTDFPVLKVYKVSEEFEENEDLISTAFKFVYILAFTQRPKVADISGFIGKAIVRQLSNGSMSSDDFQIDWRKGITTEYDTLINSDNVVYKYATISASVYTRLDSI